jgi:hypothetical protein
VEFFGKFVAKDPEVMAIIAEACDHTEGSARAVCLLAENLLKVRGSFGWLCCPGCRVSMGCHALRAEHCIVILINTALLVRRCIIDATVILAPWYITNDAVVLVPNIDGRRLRTPEQVPSSYAMLMKQSQLLLELGDVKSALDLAKLVVDLAPAQVWPGQGIKKLSAEAIDKNTPCMVTLCACSVLWPLKEYHFTMLVLLTCRSCATTS